MTPLFDDTETRTKSVTSSLVANDETTVMERKDRFLTAWNERFDGIEPPDLEFEDDSLLERRNLCVRTLHDAFSVIKSEGFLLNWISEILDIRDDNYEEPDLGRILHIIRAESTGKEFISKVENGDESPSSPNENPSQDEENVHRKSSHINQEGDFVIFDVCDTSEDIPEAANTEAKTAHVNTLVDESSGSTANAEENPCPDGGSELFKAITESGENENRAVVSDEGSTHDEEENIGQKLKECESASARDENLTTDRASEGSLESSKTPCNSCFSPDVMSESQPPEDSNEEGTLVEENRAECETSVSMIPSILIRPASRNENEPYGSESRTESQQDTEETPATGHELPALAEQENDEERSGHDSPADDNEASSSLCEPTVDESVREVNDAMSFLDTVEMSSSDEDSPCDDTILGMTRGEKSYGSDRFRSRKLDSIRSVGNASLLSMDSCVGAWALDVAASELHSADSSDENVVENQSTKPKRKSSEKKKTPLADGTKEFVFTKEGEHEDFVPIRPPRRSKRDRKYRSVDSPRRCIVGDDDVFKQEDEGYEGEPACINVCLWKIFCCHQNNLWIIVVTTNASTSFCSRLVVVVVVVISTIIISMHDHHHYHHHCYCHCHHGQCQYLRHPPCHHYWHHPQPTPMLPISLSAM